MLIFFPINMRLKMAIYYSWEKSSLNAATQKGKRKKRCLIEFTKEQGQFGSWVFVMFLSCMSSRDWGVEKQKYRDWVQSSRVWKYRWNDNDCQLSQFVGSFMLVVFILIVYYYIFLLLLLFYVHLYTITKNENSWCLK